jgi:hypothetical protein
LFDIDIETIDQFIADRSNVPAAFDPSPYFLNLLKTNKRQVKKNRQLLNTLV